MEMRQVITFRAWYFTLADSFVLFRYVVDVTRVFQKWFFLLYQHEVGLYISRHGILFRKWIFYLV